MRNVIAYLPEALTTLLYNSLYVIIENSALYLGKKA